MSPSTSDSDSSTVTDTPPSSPRSTTSVNEQPRKGSLEKFIDDKVDKALMKMRRRKKVEAAQMYRIRKQTHIAKLEARTARLEEALARQPKEELEEENVNLLREQEEWQKQRMKEKFGFQLKEAIVPVTEKPRTVGVLRRTNSF